MLKNVASIQIQKVVIYDSDRKKNRINSKQIIQILQSEVIDYFSTHSCIVNFSQYLLFVLYALRMTFFRLGVFATCNHDQSIESRDIWRPTISAF